MTINLSNVIQKRLVKSIKFLHFFIHNKTYFTDICDSDVVMAKELYIKYANSVNE